ncbi:ABC transporter substrate-binding protein [Paracoccus pantotrophus]|uniref:ABC transporter substrate-binding protein n=1 Tax=Paracoccus pantotrophus TaxID=82367 RepID=UPI0005627BF8|nr:ABC transporter substrate-binding protein [Paracoccus pantotrophus]
MHQQFSVHRRSLLLGLAATTLLTMPRMSFAQQAAPVRGGHLRFAMAGGSTQDSLDPRTYVDGVMFLTSYTSKGMLTEISSTNELVPGLAESWEGSDGGKKWVFKLRPGVTFHSGKTFDAQDAIASIDLHRGEDSSSSVKTLLAPIKSMSAPDATTVEVELSSGNADFPALLSDPHIPMLPLVNGAVDPNTKDGTGAYKLDVFEPGVRITFVRNENYWNSANGGWLDSAEILIVSDVAARMNAIRAGEVDVINRVDIKTAALLKRVRDIKVEEVESGQHSVFCMRTDTAPYTDVNVRQALKYGINRQEMVDKILMGHGQIGNDNPISRFHKFHAADLPQREYDPEKAKWHLSQAGLELLDVALSTAETGFAGANDAGQLFAESARAAGINMVTTREPDDSYWDSVWMKKPFSVDYWGFRVTADWQLSVAYAADAAYNETYWNNPRFNELLVSARSELDEAKRGEMYREMQILVHDDGGAVIPMFTNHLWATRQNVGRPADVASNWEMDGLRCVERWWVVS